MNRNWTDHDLLGISLRYSDPTRRGPGAWKANPLLAKSKTFRSALAQQLTQQQPDFDIIHSTCSPQYTWDWVKDTVKQFARSYQLAENNWRAKELKRLQSKRNMMIRQSKNRGLYYHVLETVNTQIGALQEAIAEIQALKAGKQWREKGEKHVGYIKRIATIRDTQRSIQALIDPTTGAVLDDQHNKLRIAQEYYTFLFSPDPVEPTVIQELLSAIPADLRLDADDRDLLTSEIDFDDILEVLKSSPRLSSPGSDGIPFEILNLVVRFPPYKTLILKVFNDALENANFPASWNESIMTLLKKKGDSKAITNYRPLSLANCDYKCFTKVLNRHMMSVSPKLISASQIGFIPGKYIAENGLRCQIIMEDAERRWTIAEQNDSLDSLDKDIGLLLDQEKAYDRVNLSYFRAVLNRFGFPASTIQCIYNLMALNRIRININGYFTKEVKKLRGFKQGDPLSCICYDLAFEPFLQSILQDPDFHGYQFQPDQLPVDPAPVTTKILCYADDALVFVHDRQDLRLLKYYMDLFCRASNARFNYSKVEAFSLSGRNTSRFWNRLLQDMNIHHLHTVLDPEPLIYLGFPLLQSTAQRISFVSGFIRKLKKSLQIHSGRSLSVVGKATVVNTLLFSKCWYILRVTPLTQRDLDQIRSVAIQFLKQGIFPAIPWTTWTLPRTQGGLGILDVKLQYAALYFRWVQPLLAMDATTPHSNPLMNILSIHINNHHRTEFHHLPLLLPSARRTFTRNRRSSTIDVLYLSIDRLPRDYDRVRINHATGLRLPLSTVMYTTADSSYRLPKKVSAMSVSDVFQLHSTLRFLHWKDPADPSLVPWKRAPRQLTTGIEQGNIHLQPFFLPLCNPADTSQISSDISLRPFADQLLIPMDLEDPTSRFSSRSFREACSSSNVPPPHLSDIDVTAWTFFWSLSLTMIQRNVVYRYINTCIPHKAFLHRLFPRIHLSPMCIVCLDTTDSVDHFLFTCPHKAMVWQNIITEFLWPTVDITDIQKSLLSLDFHSIRYSQKPKAPSHLIVLITLANIWKAHYRLVFTQQPFRPSSILNSIRTDIQKMIDEDNVHGSL